MTSIIIVDKNGILNEKKVKTLDKLYSSCNYRTNKDFELLHTWNDTYDLYGKKTGKSMSENKYLASNTNLNIVYYGNLCIVKKGQSLTIEEWNVFYNNINPNHNINKEINEKECINDNENCDNDINNTFETYIEDELSYDDYEEETK